MAIIGAQFDKMRVTPSLDARANQLMTGADTIGWGFSVSATGLTAIVNGGECVVKGRYFRVDGQESVNVPANWTGNICITIDLTKSNDSSGNPVYDNYSVKNNQIYVRCVTDKNLRSDDLNISGGVYDLVVAKVVSNATTLTTIDCSNVPISLTPNPNYIRSMTIRNDRVYEKIALDNATVENKYSDCHITLRRHGRICFAKIYFKSVTTLAWEQLLDINKFPGYRPDGGDYSGILNEVSYNSVPGGAYIAGATSTLTVMHVGRPDVGFTTYSGVVTYMTNDDYPNDADIISGPKQI